MHKEPLLVNLVLVGDGSVGKTCMLVSYTQDKFPTEYVPTVFENYSSLITVDSQMVNLSLWDTAGQEAYNSLRTLSYGQADIFLIVFSVINPESFENALKKWYPELEDYDPSKPKIFVGNKIDMRDDYDSNDKSITSSAAKEIIQQKGCIYLECSALSQIGLKEVFNEAVKAAINKKEQSDLSCAISGLKNNKQIAKDQQVTQEKPCCSIM